jgi:Protein of unknown function (DUF3822)
MIQIKDDTFSVDEIYKYTLCFKIAKQEIEIGVFDAANNRYLVYESYPIDKGADEIVLLEQIYKNHLFIAAGYWKRIMLISTIPKFSYVPEEFFSTKNAIDLLRFNTEVETDKLDVCYLTHTKQQISCVFAVEKHLLRWVKGKYPYQEISYLHENSCILDGLLSGNGLLESRDLYLFAHKNRLTTVSFKQGYLQYINTFSYQTPQDFIYYVLLVMEKLDFHKQSTSIVLYGNLESSISNGLGKYINSIKIGTRPEGIVFSYKFDGLKANLAFDMFSIPITTK